MAWDGSVIREVKFVKGTPSGYVVTLDCSHERKSDWTVHQILGVRRMVCPECSKAYQDRITATRASIKFEDVLRKIGELYKPTPE